MEVAFHSQRYLLWFPGLLSINKHAYTLESWFTNLQRELELPRRLNIHAWECLVLLLTANLGPVINGRALHNSSIVKNKGQWEESREVGAKKSWRTGAAWISVFGEGAPCRSPACETRERGLASGTGTSTWVEDRGSGLIYFNTVCLEVFFQS